MILCGICGCDSIEFFSGFLRCQLHLTWLAGQRLCDTWSMLFGTSRRATAEATQKFGQVRSVQEQDWSRTAGWHCEYWMSLNVIVLRLTWVLNYVVVHDSWLTPLVFVPSTSVMSSGKVLPPAFSELFGAPEPICIRAVLWSDRGNNKLKQQT